MLSSCRAFWPGVGTCAGSPCACASMDALFSGVFSSAVNLFSASLAAIRRECSRPCDCQCSVSILLTSARSTGCGVFLTAAADRGASTLGSSLRTGAAGPAEGRAPGASGGAAGWGVSGLAMVVAGGVAAGGLMAASAGTLAPSPIIAVLTAFSMGAAFTNCWPGLTLLARYSAPAPMALPGTLNKPPGSPMALAAPLSNTSCLLCMLPVFVRSAEVGMSLPVRGLVSGN